MTRDCVFFNYVFSTKTCELYHGARKDCTDTMGQPKRAVDSCRENSDDDLSTIFVSLQYLAVTRVRR